MRDYCRETGDEALLRQWASEELDPSEISPGSRKKIPWRCDKGHVWQARVNSRTAGCGCPVCAGKVILPGENDLASAYPDLAAQWDREKNDGLRPDGVSPRSNRRVWWRCEKGHSWQTIISHRTTVGSGCPYCAGRLALAGFNDLASQAPKVAAQWHPTLNGELTPEMVTVGSRKKVWWQCADGHVWQSVIYSRTGPKKCGCPICAGNSRIRRG